YERDITYHQGTVWPWLFGPWVDARIKVFGTGEENRKFVSAQLVPIKRHILEEAGLGSVSEIFDGDAPHKPCGCIAQAWSVAELLRTYVEDVKGIRPAASVDNRASQLPAQTKSQAVARAIAPVLEVSRTGTGR